MSINHDKPILMKKSKNEDNYLFLGLPKSGKTVLFVILAQAMQRYTANKTDNMAFRYCDSQTDSFVYRAINGLNKQDWPEKTQRYDSGYSFELIKNYYLSVPKITAKKGNLWKKIKSIKLQPTKPLLGIKSSIYYHDYPGEAFEVAFTDTSAGNPNIKKYADTMKAQINNARGLFLIIDAENIFNGVEKDKLRETLLKLFKHINNNNPAMKVAVLFNKIELFDQIEIDFEKEFKTSYGNAYAYKPANCKFFEVLPLGSVETNDKGVIIPPKKIVSTKLLEPLQWMLDF